MNIKITNKSLFSTMFILILITVILLVGYFLINNNSNSNKCLYIDNFTNILGETIFDETCAKNLICGETCNIVQLPKDYKFNNDDNVRNSIEDFFRL